MPYKCVKLGNKWCKVHKGTNRTVSVHDTKEKCLASIRAYYANKESRMDTVEKAIDHVLQESDDGYVAPADIDMSMDGLPDSQQIEQTWKVAIPFQIEQEYRSWGLKEMSIIAGDFDVPYTITDIDGNDVKEGVAKVVGSKIHKIDWADTNGTGLGIDSIDLILNADGTVNYDKTVLTLSRF